MNKKQYQKGSGHLVIIIVLVIALLGALGFVFWQNFIQPKNTLAPISALDDKTDGDKNLVITEWGVKGEYSGSHPISYYISPYNGKLFFKSSDLSDLCTDGIGNIIRFYKNDYTGGWPTSNTPDDFVDIKASEAFALDSDRTKRVGDYYYGLQNAGQACIDTTDAELQQDIFTDINKYLKTLEMI